VSQVVGVETRHAASAKLFEHPALAVAMPPVNAILSISSIGIEPV